MFDTAASTNLTLGALQSADNFTKQDSGQMTVATAANAARTSGTVTLAGGILQVGNASALGTVGVALQLNSGTLDLATASSINAYNTTVGGSVTINSDRRLQAVQVSRKHWVL